MAFGVVPKGTSIPACKTLRLGGKPEGLIMYTPDGTAWFQSAGMAATPLNRSDRSNTPTTNPPAQTFSAFRPPLGRRSPR